MITHAILRGTNLEDDIGTAFEVVRRQRAFTRVHPTSCAFGARGQRLNGRFRYCAKAHARYVEEAVGGVGMFTVRAYGDRSRFHGIFFQRGVGAVDKNHRTNGFEVARRSEANGGVDPFSSLINPSTFRPVERQLLAVHREKVLAKEFAEMFEEVAKPSDDRKVATHRMLGLRHVDDVNNYQSGKPHPEGEEEDLCHYFDDAVGEIHGYPQFGMTLRAKRSNDSVICSGVCSPCGISRNASSIGTAFDTSSIRLFNVSGDPTRSSGKP